MVLHVTSRMYSTRMQSVYGKDQKIQDLSSVRLFS